MRKFALLALVAVLSVGFVGCAGTFKKPIDLPDPDQATVVGLWVSDKEGSDPYVVVLEHKLSYAPQEGGRFVALRVDKATFESVHEGDKVEIELISFTRSQDNKYLLATEYCWHVGGKNYQVIFESDAKKRPVPPKADPKSS